MQRPFKVLGVQQIAIGGPSKEKLKTLWVDMLGLDVTGNFVSERENVDEDICAMGAGAFKVEVDLMQPVDPDYLKSVLDSVRDEASTALSSSLASPPPTPIPTPSTTTYGLTPSTSARPTDSSAPSTFRKLEDGSRRSTGRSS